MCKIENRGWIPGQAQLKYLKSAFHTANWWAISEKDVGNSWDILNAILGYICQQSHSNIFHIWRMKEALDNKFVTSWLVTGF